MEIGSEFHTIAAENASGFVFPRAGTLTFSGRTAIEAVLTAIPHAKTALLPSYCCDSMIDPFRKAEIAVSFYDVGYSDRLTVKVNGEADILLWCNYFGFRSEMPNFDGIVIEDITHSLFSEVSHHPRSDYLVASVRKWEPLYCGGYCSVKADVAPPPSEFIHNKARAMDLKAAYLAQPDETKKPVFLEAFKAGNGWLAAHYSGLGMDSYSKEYLSRIDAQAHRDIRRSNARILYEGLRDKVQFLFAKEQMDCPLFVPIVLHERRAQIRQHLADNRIYCPIHWPHPNADCTSNLYDIELSLICDQRYNETDMQRLVQVLSDIL